MAGLVPHKTGHDESEAWLITYADAITLVLSFFIIMMSMAKFDVAKYEQMAEGMTRDIAGREFQSSIKLLKLDVQDVIYSMQAEENISVGTDERGVIIELASSAFYRPGSAEIRTEALPVLQKLAATAKTARYRSYGLEVEGHTDDDPISTPQFPSNWELSAGRAARIVRFFTQQGFEPQRLKAIAFADSRPKVPNRDAKSAPIRENQAMNRRVSIRIYPLDDAELANLERDVEKSRVGTAG